MSAVEKSISLALSGGGIRAMVFHMGVLKALAERQLLEKIARISTVSGGSLLVGLILKDNGWVWPSSEIYLREIYPTLRQKLCSRSLLSGAIRQLINPKNWKFLLSRANLLAMALEHEWEIKASLSELPKWPEWSINGTTAENGKRFRFKESSIGDYELGYAKADEFSIADAMAVSAAFPGGFGPLVIDTTKFIWKRRPWGSPIGTEVTVDIGYKQLHLYDGGVYDNLGLEPFFDSGHLQAKQEDTYIFASDAGAPLAAGFNYGALSLFRLKRVTDIMADQAHALRVRTFSTYLQENGDGALIYINTPLIDTETCESAAYAANFPTTLRALKFVEFDKLADHGYAVTLLHDVKYSLISKIAS